jgi:hypothetical protein
MKTKVLLFLGGMTATLGCESRGTNDIVFFDGRAVEAIGDSVIAVTKSPEAVVEVLDLRTDETTTFGGGQLQGPFHVQFAANRWFVSDVVDGAPSISVFDQARGGPPVFAGRIDLSGLTTLPHQFAVLPDGRIVVEAPDNMLIAVADDSVSTFALTERGPRPSVIVGTRGGVLHAVPDHHLTLYNAFGHIRWRTEWPWNENAFVTDIAVDERSRIHVLAGIQETAEGLFRVYSLVGETGEVVWWSEPGTYATFVVSTFGNVTADSTGRWF